VRTYINSGNVLFRTTTIKLVELMAQMGATRFSESTRGARTS
jgi:uncharacterized protein (DUF1697 family)